MRYALTDIHGCPGTLRLALDRVGYRPADELFFLGDYIDRGPDSQGVVDFIRELEAAGNSVVCLRGNHEQLLIDYDDRAHGLYEWQPAPEHYERTLAWMKALPYYHLTPGYVLVHAGLDFGRPDPLDNTYAMLWERYWYGKIDYAWLGDRVVVHGHTPATLPETKNAVKHMRMNRFVGIDSGCAHPKEGMGYLTVLNLDTGEGTYVRRVD